jgi:Acyl-CoA oxidase
MKQALKDLRPHMIPLTELDTTPELDMSYLSAIGNEYGDIYETQLEWAMKSRLNKDPIPDYFHTIIKPMAKGEKL